MVPAPFHRTEAVDKTCDGCRAIVTKTGTFESMCALGFKTRSTAASKYGIAPDGDCPKPRTYHDWEVEKEKKAKREAMSVTGLVVNAPQNAYQEAGYVKPIVKPKPVPLDEDGGKEPDPLSAAWDRLTPEEQQGTIRQAAKNARFCLPCKWFVTETHLDEFPMIARKGHLMLCPYKDFMRAKEAGE
jgi:hypothetical protein